MKQDRSTEWTKMPMTLEPSLSAEFFQSINVGSRVDVHSLSECATIVREGGAIQLSHAATKANLANARMVVTIQERISGKIVAVGTIKEDRPWYREQQFLNANFAMDGYENASEVGYVAVDAALQGRGLSGAIMSKLVGSGSKFFATTDDIRMKKALTKSSFNCVGGEWQGGRGMLSLWVKD